MSELPERTVEATWRAVHALADVEWGWGTSELCDTKFAADISLAAAMDPALGPDRLVVAGPFEQEIIEKVCVWLEDNAPEAPSRWTGRILARELRAEMEAES